MDRVKVAGELVAVAKLLIAEKGYVKRTQDHLEDLKNLQTALAVDEEEAEGKEKSAIGAARVSLGKTIKSMNELVARLKKL